MKSTENLLASSRDDLDFTAQQFFSDNPEHAGGVKRAILAYHANHREPGAHYFDGIRREASCRWCGQTREGVRWNWYGKPPTCEARPKWADQSIESVIAREEVQFEKVMERAKKLAAEIDIEKLDGDGLARLHHTYGVDPSMLETALMLDGRSLPQSLHDDYQRAYSEHRKTGKRGLVRVVIALTPQKSNSHS